MSVFGKDPDAELLAKIEKLNPNVKPRSQATMVEEVYMVDRTTGREGRSMSIKGVTRIDDDTVRVSVAWWSDPETGSGKDYIARVQGRGWKIDSVVPTYIS